MNEFAWVLMVAGGLGLMAIGLRNKGRFEITYGILVMANALFGYLARRNELYSWAQVLAGAALVSIVAIRLLGPKKRL